MVPFRRPVLHQTPGSPRLVAFDFDLDMGTMTLSLNEAVNITTFQLGQLTLAEEMVDTTHYN